MAEDLSIEEKAKRYDLMWKYLTVNEYAAITEIERLHKILDEKGITYEPN